MSGTIKTFSTPYGELAIDTIADAKMAAVFARGNYHQKDTVELLSAFITPESVFVDCGAHIGTLAIPLARTAGRTVAYEANAHTCALLRQNVEHNSVAVDVRQKGIGAKAGRGHMALVREGNAGAHTLAVGEGGVEIVTLDGEMERFDVLKLDVEGMELAALQGAVRIIREAHPIVLFEVNLSQLRSHDAAPSALNEFFWGKNYRLYLPFRLQGELVLGAIPSLSIVALCMYPGAYLFHRTSSVFDILALPSDKPTSFPIMSAGRTMLYVITENLRDKFRRIRKHFI